MPQMAPLNWMYLFLIFLMTFYMMMNILYFLFMKKINNKIKINKNMKNYNKLI